MGENKIARVLVPTLITLEDNIGTVNKNGKASENSIDRHTRRVDNVHGGLPLYRDLECYLVAFKSQSKFIDTVDEQATCRGRVNPSPPTHRSHHHHSESVETCKEIPNNKCHDFYPPPDHIEWCSDKQHSIK